MGNLQASISIPLYAEYRNPCPTRTQVLTGKKDAVARDGDLLGLHWHYSYRPPSVSREMNTITMTRVTLQFHWHMISTTHTTNKVSRSVVLNFHCSSSSGHAE
jgi:hypothetical protein